MKFSVGLEINEHYLKVVVAQSQRLKPPKLFDCAVEPILSLSDEQVIKKITDIFKKWKIKPANLVVSLPRNLVTVRNLHLPSQDRQEITQMINLHIGRVVPFKKEEIVYGYLSLGLDDMGYAKELLAIAHTDIVNRQTRILEKAGLFIDNVNLSSFGIWQWIINQYHSEMNQNDFYLLLDIDSVFTDFIIFSRNNLLFTRNIPIKIKDNLNSNDVTKIVGEIRQSLVIFQNEEVNKKPTRIYLTGASMAGDLSKVIEDELGIPVKLALNPYVGALVREKNKEIPKDASLIAVTESVLGASDKVLSFILPEIQIRRTLKEKMRELNILGTLIIYLFTGTVALFLGRLFNEQAYLKKLNVRTQSIKKEMGDLVEQTRKIEFIKGFLRSRRVPLFFLSELQQLVPDEISIDYMSLDEANNITLRGQAIQLSDVFQFVTTLENSKYFKDVATKYTRTKKVRDKEINNFEITFQLTI